jgi:hypothetical protein
MSAEDVKKTIKEYAGYILICLIIIFGSVAKDFSTKYLKDQEWTFKSLYKDSKRNSQINKIISDLRAKVDADNVSIFMFHNGGFFSSGVPYRKKSSVYESNAIDNYNSFDYKNIPLSQVAELIARLTETQNTFYIRTNSIHQSQWRFMLTNENYKFSYYKRIQIGQKMIGYIRVSYKKETPSNQNHINLIDDYSDPISSLLAMNEDLF